MVSHPHLPNGEADPTRPLTSRVAPLIARAPVPMVEVEGPLHTVCFVNPAFCRLVQKTRAELIGQPFDQIVRNGEKCKALLDRVYETGEFETHVDADHSDASPAYWLYAMWPALGANEKPERVVIQLTKSLNFQQNIAAMNEALLISGLREHELREAAEKSQGQALAEIAHRVRAEDSLREANDGLRLATRVAEQANLAKDELLAALSHELRMPLTPVLLAAGALREDPRLPPDIRERLGMIERNIALEARLVDDLLDLTKISQGKLHLRAERCDAHALIDHAIDIVQNDAREKGLTIERQFAAAHYELMADPARFLQVLWNLMRNAVKFTPREGHIMVRTHEENVPGEGWWLRIAVTDTGIGIAPAAIGRIFLPFDQGGLAGDHRFGGVGLGLSIARAVVLLHGGRITAESAGENQGATFVVELPGASRPQAEVAMPVPLEGAGSPTAGKKPSLRLLLVDDHAATLKTLAHILEQDGHAVVTAGSVAAALAAAAGNPFDLVVSDLGLPDGTGNELMAKLRASHGLRGIALSGYGMQDDLNRSHAAGFIAHLVKPVAIAELRRVLAAAGPAKSQPSP